VECVVPWPMVGPWASRSDGAAAAPPRTSVAWSSLDARLRLAVADVEMNHERRKGSWEGRKRMGQVSVG